MFSTLDWGEAYSICDREGRESWDCTAFGTTPASDVGVSSGRPLWRTQLPHGTPASPQCLLLATSNACISTP